MNHPSRLFPHRGVGAVALLTAAMMLAACGGGGSSDSSKTEDDKGSAPAAAQDDDRTSTSSTDRTSTKEAELTFFLPEKVDAEAGTRVLADRCDTTDEWGAWTTYAVPESWEASGFGRSGGTSPDNGSLDHIFSTTGGKVGIKVGVDTRDDEGRITNGSYEPSESFDYEITIGDTTTNVEYVKVSSVEVGDQTLDLFKVAHADYPDVATIYGDVYKARFAMMEISGGDQVRPIEVSAVITIDFDPTEVALTEDDVAAIVASIALPECSRTSLLVTYELMLNTDLNGDGEISTAQDMMDLAR